MRDLSSAAPSRTRRHARRGRLRAIGACAVLNLLAFAGAPAVAHASSPSHASTLEAVLAAATPDDAVVVPFLPDATASAGDVSVELSTSDAGAISVETGPAAHPMSADIRLPEQFDTTAGAALPDGTVAYPDHERSGDQLAVQLLDDGTTRVQTVLASPRSPREYSYSLDGFTPSEGADSFGFVAESAEGAFVPVAAAWATDARGAAVATHYEIRGAALVQVVSPSADAVYPIVADPAWSWMWGGYGAKLDRYETRRALDYSYAVGMCVAVGRYANKGLGIACGVYGSYIAAQAHLAESDRPRRCLYLVVFPAPLVMRYRDGHCR